MALEPVYTNGKRDAARRYRDTTTGETVSRRQAEGLTEKQRESRRLKATGQQVGHQAPRRSAPFGRYSGWVRYGPYYNLSSALHEPRISDHTKVLIGAYGRFGTAPKSGTEGTSGWLALWQTAEYQALRKGDAYAGIQRRIRENFEYEPEVRGYYLWVRA